MKDVIRRCMQRARGNVQVITRQATTEDIINTMLRCDPLVGGDMKEVAEHVEGYCLEETCNNIWFLLTECVDFVEDPMGKQDLLAPNQLLKNGKGDCKSFSLCIASILQALQVPYVYRFISNTSGDNVHHVYVVACEENGNEIIIDATITHFNKELPYAKKEEHLMVNSAEAEAKYVEHLQSRGEAVPAELNGKKYVNAKPKPPEETAKKAIYRTQPPPNHLGEAFTCGTDEWSECAQPFVNRKSSIGNRIGDITDDFLLNLAPNKRDALRATIRDNIKQASPIFLYMFYFRYAYNNPRPLPRAALYKLKKSIELYMEFSKAFEMNIQWARTGFNCVIEMIDAYFKNEQTLQRSAEWGDNKAEWYRLQLYTHMHMTSSDLVQPTGQNFLFNILKNHGLQTGNFPPALSQSALPALNVSWNIPVTPESICALYVELMYYKHPNGTEIYKTLEMLPAVQAMFREYQRSAGAPPNLVDPESVIRNAFEKSVTDNAWVTAYYTAKANTSNNLVVFCLADDFQKAQFASMYPQGRYVFVDLRWYTGDAEVKKARGAFKVVKNMKQANLIALELDMPAPPGGSQKVIAGIYLLPQIINSKAAGDAYVAKTRATITPKLMKNLSVLHCGAYKVETAIGLAGVFDPDGLPLSLPAMFTMPDSGQSKAFTVASTTPYVSGNRVGEVATVITAVVAAIGTIMAAIGGIIASVKNVNVSGIDVGSPATDYRFDIKTCKWQDESKGIMSCQLPDGSWVLVDANTYTEIGPDPTGGQTESPITQLTSNPLLLAAGAGLLLLSSGNNGKVNGNGKRRIMRHRIGKRRKKKIAWK